jgi:hypothetical protein
MIEGNHAFSQFIFTHLLVGFCHLRPKSWALALPKTRSAAWCLRAMSTPCWAALPRISHCMSTGPFLKRKKEHWAMVPRSRQGSNSTHLHEVDICCSDVASIMYMLLHFFVFQSSCLVFLRQKNYEGVPHNTSIFFFHKSREGILINV